MVAYWSIGNSRVANLKFRSYSKFIYFGNVFKNDTNRTDVSSMFDSCVFFRIDLTPLSDLVNVTKASYLFYSCRFLSFIDLTPLASWVNVTDASSLFYSLTGLSTIDINPLASWVNVTVASRLFYNCGKLRSIDLTALVKWTKMVNNEEMFILSGISDYISIRDVPPFPLTSNALNGTRDCPIYVPDNAVDTYKTATNWSAYADRIKPISSKPS